MRQTLALSLFLVLTLAACGASPALRFIGAERKDVEIEGYRFAVFQKGKAVEVIRLGYLTLEQRDAVPMLMEQAAEQVTGCKVAAPLPRMARSPSPPGDTGEARFLMRC